jgi:hypothetical protein
MDHLRFFFFTPEGKAQSRCRRSRSAQQAVNESFDCKSCVQTDGTFSAQGPFNPDAQQSGALLMPLGQELSRTVRKLYIKISKGYTIEGWIREPSCTEASEQIKIT